MTTIKFIGRDGSTVTLKPYHKNLTFEYVMDAVSKASFQYPIKASPELNDMCLRSFVEIKCGNEYFYGVYIKKSDTLTDKETMRSFEISSIDTELSEVVCVENLHFKRANLSSILTYSATQPNVIQLPNWSTTVQPNALEWTYLASLETPNGLFEKLTESLGIHRRWKGTPSDPRNMEFGFFGEIVRDDGSLKQNFTDKGSTWIKSLEICENSMDVVNILKINGGGDTGGTNMGTLRDVDPALVASYGYNVLIDVNNKPNSNVNYPLPLNDEIRMGPSNEFSYYLQDTQSVNKYGPIERAVVYKDLVVTSTNDRDYDDSDREDQSNEIYKKGVQLLLRKKDEHKTYKVSYYGDLSDVCVGNQIPLKFKGECTTSCTVQGRVLTSVTLADIDEYVYVVRKKVTEEESGIKCYELEVSNRMQSYTGDYEQFKKIVRDQDHDNKQRKGSVSHIHRNLEDSLDAGIPKTFFLENFINIERWNYMRVRVRVLPFRANSQQQVTGGTGAVTGNTGLAGGINFFQPAHRHTVPLYNFVNPTIDALNVQFSPALNVFYVVNGGGTPYQINTTLSGQIVINQPAHAHPISGTVTGGTANTQYGIYEDPTPPTGLTICWDGEDYTPELLTASGLGGTSINAFGFYPAINIDEPFDLLEAVRNRGTGAWNSFTENFSSIPIEVKCTEGKARIQIEILGQLYIGSQ